MKMARSATKGARQATAGARKGAPARGPRAVRQAERREAILAAALDEFAASGFAATRLDDVAKRAGVAKGTIYL
jgi:AcrR family transcriptional regulator